MEHIDEHESFTSVKMMIPKTAKKAMTMRNDMLVRSLEPHVPFLLRFFDDFARISFFDGSFEYISSGALTVADFALPPTQTLSLFSFQLIFLSFGDVSCDNESCFRVSLKGRFMFSFTFAQVQFN